MSQNENNNNESELFNRLVNEISQRVTDKIATVSVPVKRGPGRPPKVVKESQKGRISLVPDNVFVQAMKESDSIRDMIKKVPQLSKMSYKKARSYIIAHAAYLRKQGKQLKYFPRGRIAHQT